MFLSFKKQIYRELSLKDPVTPATMHVREHLLFLAATPRADELDLASARVDLPLLDLPELLLAHGLHLVRLRYLQRKKEQKNTNQEGNVCWVRATGIKE